MSLFGDVKIETRFPAAEFSPCRRYRYTLWREWPDAKGQGKGYLAVIGLNPSTADESNDDPTIRRCINFAKDWGCTGLYMLNLFAFRATDPDVMKAEPEPVGPDNDAAILRVTKDAAMVLAAWGIHGVHQNRDRAVMALVRSMLCLGTTQSGQPKHPLYIKGDTMPTVFSTSG